MKVLVDENLTPSMVQRLAAKGVVADHVAHIGMPGATDPQVWRYACEHDQIVVTRTSSTSPAAPSCTLASSSCEPPVGYRARSSGPGWSR